MLPGRAEGYTRQEERCWCCVSRFKVKYSPQHDDVSVSKLFNLQLSIEQECVIEEPGARSSDNLSPAELWTLLWWILSNGRRAVQYLGHKIINHYTVKIKHSQIRTNKKQKQKWTSTQIWILIGLITNWELVLTRPLHSLLTETETGSRQTNDEVRLLWVIACLLFGDSA